MVFLLADGAWQRFRWTLSALKWLGASAAGSGAVPSITKVTVLPTRQLELQMALDVRQSYAFEISTNLVDWMAVAGIEDVTTSSMTIVDENTVDLAPALFFRLKEGRYVRFSFGFAHYIQAGQFEGVATTPTTSLPAIFNGYRAWFEAEGAVPGPWDGLGGEFNAHRREERDCSGC